MLDKRIEGAAHPLVRNWTAGKLLLTHRTEFSSPCVAIPSPLGVQGLGRHVRTHDDEVHRRQSSAVSSKSSPAVAPLNPSSVKQTLSSPARLVSSVKLTAPSSIDDSSGAPVCASAKRGDASL